MQSNIVKSNKVLMADNSWLSDLDIGKLLMNRIVAVLSTNSGWTQTVTGSGGSSQQATYQRINTGFTASSKGELYNGLAISNGTTINPSAVQINYDKKTWIMFSIARLYSDIECIHRIQIKAATTAADFIAKGLGIKVLDDGLGNFEVYAESYGTSRAEIDTGVALSNNIQVRVAIVLYPGASRKIEWYINNQLVATQSDTAKVPSGLSTSNYVHSIVNGVTGSIDCIAQLATPIIIQEV